MLIFDRVLMLELIFLILHLCTKSVNGFHATTTSNLTNSKFTKIKLFKAVENNDENALREEISLRNENLSNIDPRPLDQYIPYKDILSEGLTKKRPYLIIIAEKIVERLDPLFFFKDEPKDLKKRAQEKEKIVLLGSGWGGHSFLKDIDSSKYDIKVVSPRNYFLMTPMLAASAIGTVEFRSITDPIRNVNSGADYIEATCIDFHSKANQISCQNVVCEGTSCKIEDFDLSYDHLIVSVGATSNTFGIPGVRENCIFMKQISDAIKLRKAIGNCYERANLPNVNDELKKKALTFVIVGGGPTGVELTAELRDFIEQDAPRFYPDLIQYTSLKLVEASGNVLMAFDKELQTKALKDLLERPTTLIKDGYISYELTEVILNAGVEKITDTEVILKNGESISYGFCVWAAGNGPLPLVVEAIQSIDVQNSLSKWGKGRLVVDDWLRVKGTSGIYAIGDCGVIYENPLPQTAQVAAQQGAFLARLFNRSYNLTESLPTKKEGRLFLSERLGLSANPDGNFARGFAFLNLGILAYTGGGNALAQVQLDQKSIKSSGNAGYLLWRSIYLSKQVSWRNRFLVMIDWTKAKVFGRDIVRF